MLQIALWLGIGYLGGRVLAKKGYAPKLGVLIGVILGPIGVVASLLLPRTKEGQLQKDLELDLKEEGRVYDRRKFCPQCSRQVSLMTAICPNCERRFF